jgi:hypothetical protein
MTAPSVPLGPGSGGRGAAFKRGIVVAVEGNIAWVKTSLTETLPVRRDIMPAKGRLPEVGEQWMLTRPMTYWTFALILEGGSKSNDLGIGDIDGLQGALDDVNGSLDDVNESLTVVNGEIVTLDSRADQADAERAYLSRWVGSYTFLQEAALFGNIMMSMPMVCCTSSVAVSGAGRYVNFGAVPGAYLITGCRVAVSVAVAGATVTLRLYHGPMNNMASVATASVSGATVGMRVVNWSSTYTTVPGEYIAVGMATTTAGVSVAGFESFVVSNEPRAQVAILGATTTLNAPLVMGPTSPHTITQGRHWVGLY